MKGFGMISKGVAQMMERPDPKIETPGDAIIKTAVVAPCTSDVHLIENCHFPGMFGHFIGHEAGGVIAEVGDGVKDFKVGDRVIVPDICPDWTHRTAQMGWGNYTPNVSRTINPNMEGMFAEYIHVPNADRSLARIPDNVPWEQAVMAVDMMDTAFSMLPYLKIEPGETVAVLGIGPVGLMGIAAASISGAGRVFGVGSRQACFDAAFKLGATDVVSYKDGPIAEQILQKLGTEMVDKVMICGGDDDTVREA